MEKEKILSGFGMMIAGALILTAALITAAVYAELVQSAYWPIIGRYGTSLLGTGGFITVPGSLWFIFKGMKILSCEE